MATATASGARMRPAPAGERPLAPSGSSGARKRLPMLVNCARKPARAARQDRLAKIRGEMKGSGVVRIAPVERDAHCERERVACYHPAGLHLRDAELLTDQGYGHVDHGVREYRNEERADYDGQEKADIYGVLALPGHAILLGDLFAPS